LTKIKKKAFSDIFNKFYDDNVFFFFKYMITSKKINLLILLMASFTNIWLL